ncbi:hypothetical protein [Amycolatopsis sp. NPDC049868]|uniref:hypothetical protein n=1 Tax=Amycolatopsis sp. NPDC049868 TaxID=3363934 RepID=UPI0037A0B73E
MTHTPDPVAAIRRLHHQIRGFSVHSDLWRIQRELPDVPHDVLSTAWDPDSPVLLEKRIYVGIVRGCHGTQQQLDQVLNLYEAVKTALDGTGQPAGAATEPLSTPQFDKITSRADFTAVLSQLRQKAGLSLRETHQATKEFDPSHPTPRSTLSDWLRHGVLPQQRPELRVLLQVFLCRIVAPTDVEQHLEDLMRAWDLVRRADRGQIIKPAIQLNQAELLAKLTRRHREAYECGDINHHGLAEAIRIVEDLG